jgi:hypothetical protein
MSNLPPCCHCGAVAEIGFQTKSGTQWLCTAHAPWQCIGCGPESGDEDNYASADVFKDEE